MNHVMHEQCICNIYVNMILNLKWSIYKPLTYLDCNLETFVKYVFDFPWISFKFYLSVFATISACCFCHTIKPFKGYTKPSGLNWDLTRCGSVWLQKTNVACIFKHRFWLAGSTAVDWTEVRWGKLLLTEINLTMLNAVSCCFIMLTYLCILKKLSHIHCTVWWTFCKFILSEYVCNVTNK